MVRIAGKAQFSPLHSWTAWLAADHNRDYNCKLFDERDLRIQNLDVRAGRVGLYLSGGLGPEQYRLLAGEDSCAHCLYQTTTTTATGDDTRILAVITTQPRTPSRFTI
jgi:hypothetical protein